MEVINMRLVPWTKRTDTDVLLNPLTDFRKEMDGLFDSFFDKGRIIRDSGAFTPSVEVSEDEKSYTVKAELPGMKKEDVEVSLHDNNLILKGEKKEEKEGKKKSSYYREACYGSFCRQIPLEHGVNEKEVKAIFKDGVLTLSMPKKKTAGSKTTKISIE
jgi:HSP20 family protein